MWQTEKAELRFHTLLSVELEESLILETGKVDRNTLGDAYNRTPLFYAAKSGHRNIVKLFLVIGIPIGYTYGYEQKNCDSEQHQDSLKRLVKRHIRANGHYSTRLKHKIIRGRLLTRWLRHHVKRLSYIRSRKRIRDGSMKKALRRTGRRLFRHVCDSKWHR
jgi:hypothetical protein